MAFQSVGISKLVKKFIDRDLFNNEFVLSTIVNFHKAYNK